MKIGPVYIRTRGNQGLELRRKGATTHCIVCGIPDLTGVLTFAHIHIQDLTLSPDGNPSRVFRLCWHQHHGCYDQG
jgi:hypothetical protein